MASTNKTSLGLNQWVASDKPVRQDFVNDNTIVDNKLSQIVNDMNRFCDFSNAPDINVPSAIITFCDQNTSNTPFKQGLTIASGGLCISYQSGNVWNSQLFIVNGEGMYRRYVNGQAGKWSVWTLV